MTALYFAVPAVTGQVILGAKAGAASLATSALGDNAKDAGGAAKSGFQGDMASRVTNAQNVDAQAAWGKAMRKGGLAKAALALENDNLGRDFEAAKLDGKSSYLQGIATAKGQKAEQYKGAMSAVSAWAGAAGGLGEASGLTGGKGGGGGGGAGGGAPGLLDSMAKAAGTTGRAAIANAQFRADSDRHGATIASTGQGLDMGWDMKQLKAESGAAQLSAQRLQAAAGYDADMGAWQAKYAFSQRHAGMASVYGVNAGSLNAGEKPKDRVGMAFSGELGSDAKREALGAHSFLDFLQDTNALGIQKSTHGSSQIIGAWQHDGKDINKSSATWDITGANSNLSDAAKGPFFGPK